MQCKYYKVQAKCGHVGRNHYILKYFYIKALDGREAALIVRYMPRVKHHHKDAIKDVTEISIDEYLDGLKIQSADLYFKCTSRQEQEKYKCVDLDEILLEENNTIGYKRRMNGQIRKFINIEKEMNQEIRGVMCYGQN